MSTKTDSTLEFIKTVNSELFRGVKEYLYDALIVAWDGCHKIYIGMDEEQADWFRENYASTDYSTSQIFEGSVGEMLQTLAMWWNESCPLRFIQAVHTNHEDPNAGFEVVIDQGADDEDEEDEEDYFPHEDEDDDE